MFYIFYSSFPPPTNALTTCMEYHNLAIQEHLISLDKKKTHKI